MPVLISGDRPGSVQNEDRAGTKLKGPKFLIAYRICLNRSFHLDRRLPLHISRMVLKNMTNLEIRVTVTSHNLHLKDRRDAVGMSKSIWKRHERERHDFIIFSVAASVSIADGVKCTCCQTSAYAFWGILT